MKKILLGLSLVGALLLGGCQEGESFEASSYEIPNYYPESVKNGTVSFEYYKEYETYIDELAIYMQEVNKQQKRDTRTMEAEEFKSLLKECLVFTNSNKTITTINSVDKEIEDYRYNINYYFDEKLEYLLKYIETNEKVYLSMFQDANINYNHNVSILREISKKYDLN